jgi:hypothetical protein
LPEEGSANQFAMLLGIAYPTIRMWVLAEGAPAIKKANGRFVLAREAFIAWLREKRRIVMTLHEQIEYWKHRAEIAEAKAATMRSEQWPAARKAHLKKEPLCQYCGGEEHLEIHHCVPFHLDKTKELRDDNLITLCEAPGQDCHLKIGHLGNWKRFNPNVRDVCAKKRGSA